MGNPGWKQYERRISRLFGVERKGILGGADFETEHFAGETKVLAEIPKKLAGWYAQANKNCPPPIPMPIAATSQIMAAVVSPTR